MRHTLKPDHQTTLNVTVSHAQLGEVGKGQLKFGYGCVASVVLDSFTANRLFDNDQLATNLIATSTDGKKWSLLDCTQSGYTIYPDFVVESDVRESLFNSFEVRYSEVSKWFFEQMRVDGQLGQEIKWCATPSPLIANIKMPNCAFRIESVYVASLEDSGEVTTIHQYFAFRFFTTDRLFTPSEIKDIARQFGNFLSILLAHQCQIVSIDVSSKGSIYRRMYYGIYKLQLDDFHYEETYEKIKWRNFFVLKSDIDNCWEDIVNHFFNSKYCEIIWCRLAGMQNYEGFWEYHILGYITLLEGYLSLRFTSLKKPTVPQTENIKKLAKFLAEVSPPLKENQKEAIIEKSHTIFLKPKHSPFSEKFNQLISFIDLDINKIINLTTDDFIFLKKFRDSIAHGDQIEFTGNDITPIITLANKINLLLTHLLFVDLGLKRDLFLQCLSRPLNKLRRISKIDEQHLDRTLHPEIFIKVSSQEIQKIKNRPRRLLQDCFERDLDGNVTYSDKYSIELDKRLRDRIGGMLYEIIGLPKNSMSFLHKAYFEDGMQTEVVNSPVIIEVANLPKSCMGSGKA